MNLLFGESVDFYLGEQAEAAKGVCDGLRVGLHSPGELPIYRGNAHENRGR